MGFAPRPLFCFGEGVRARAAKPQIKPTKINLSLFGRWEEMRMIKAVLFDMDGVLVDTEWFYNRRRVAFMEEKGFHFDEIPDLSGSNEPAIWKSLVPDDVELRERLRVEYKQVYSPVHPVPYAELLNEQTEPVMRELHERGVKCAIASSS